MVEQAAFEEHDVVLLVAQPDDAALTQIGDIGTIISVYPATATADIGCLLEVSVNGGGRMVLTRFP